MVYIFASLVALLPGVLKRHMMLMLVMLMRMVQMLLVAMFKRLTVITSVLKKASARRRPRIDGTTKNQQLRQL